MSSSEVHVKPRVVEFSASSVKKNVLIKQEDSEDFVNETKFPIKDTAKGLTTTSSKAKAAPKKKPKTKAANNDSVSKFFKVFNAVYKIPKSHSDLEIYEKKVIKKFMSRLGSKASVGFAIKRFPAVLDTCNHAMLAKLWRVFFRLKTKINFDECKNRRKYPKKFRQHRILFYIPKQLFFNKFCGTIL